MALISTYPVVTPTTDDLLIGTNGSDGKTKNFTVASVVALGGGAVSSVNGETGAVVLDATDVGADPTGTAAGLVSAHEADTTAVHGIADTSALIIEGDSRLTNNRAPVAHHVTHESGGVDALTLAQSQIAGLVSTLADKVSASATQAAATVFAGPDSGSDTAPAFRALVATDIPAHLHAGSDLYSPISDSIHGNQTAGGLHAVAGLVNGFMSVADKTKLDGIDPGANAGVASVSMTVPSILSVTGSPITGTGTFAVTLANEAINTIFAGPASGSSAAPTFRAMVANDLPATAAKTNVDNQFTVGQGVRGALSGNAAAVYIPWITGDSLTTVVIGSSSASNNVQALNAASGSATAIVGQSGTGIAINAVRSTALTNTAATALNATHRTSGTPAASFGANVRIQLQSTTTVDQDAGQMAALWTDATHATRTSALAFSTVNSAAALTEQMRITGAGAALHRSTDATQAAGVYAPWISGDALPAIRAGSTNSSNNQIGIRGSAYSAQGIYGEANTGIGTYGTSVSGPGVQGQTTSGQGVYAIAGASGTALQSLHSANLTNTVANAAILLHRTSGTPAASFGAALKFGLQSTTTNDQDAGLVSAVWTDPTHASRKARLALSASDSAATREGLRIEADGSAARLGFFGGTAVVKPSVTGSRGGNAALASLLTSVAGTGLLTDSTTAGVLAATNVIDYGAVGDGTTDDTLAIRSAITAAAASGVLLFPPGKTFLLSGSLNPLSGQTWTGYGAKLKRRNAISTATTTNIGTGTNPTSLTVTSSASFTVGMDVTVFNGATHEAANHRITAIADSTHITVADNFLTAFASGGTVVTSFAQIDTQPSVGTLSRVRIEGLEFDGNQSNNTTLQWWANHQELYFGSDYGRLINLYVHDAQSEGILVHRTDVLVQGCTVLNCQGNGIHMGATSQSPKIIGNYIKSTNLGGATPGHLSGGIAYSSNNYDALITNNYVEAAYAGVGTLANSTNIRAVISNNIFKSCTNYGIQIDVASTDYVEDVSIVGNTFVSCVQVRINQAGGTSLTLGPRKLSFLANVFEDTLFVLAGVNNSSIVGNTISNSGITADIFTIDDSSGVSISNNLIVGGKGGIVLGAGASRGVSIKGNTFRNQYKRSVYFWADAVGGIDISGNTFLLDTAFTADAAWKAINMDGNGATVSGNHIHTQKNVSGHVCIQCPAGGASTQGAIVTGNTIRCGALVHSIETPAGSQKNIIVNNFIQQAVTDGGSPNNTVSGNTTIL